MIKRTATAKQCSKCKQMKLYEEFHHDKNRKDNYAYWCKACANACNPEKERRYKDRRKQLWHSKPNDHPSKLKKYASNRLRRRAFVYGITLDEFASLLASQGGACPICGVKFESLPSQNIHLDHCHVTNRIRGILCNKCNVLLGFAGDEPTRLLRAAAYINNALQTENA